MQPFTRVCPKALLPYFGHPLLQYHFDDLSGAQIKTVVINAHHLSQRLAHESADIEKNFELQISDESELLLDSAGGVRKAMDHIQEDEFLVLNADTLSTVNLQGLMSFYLELQKKEKELFGVIHLQKNQGNFSYRSWSFDSTTRQVLSLSKNPENQGYFYTGTALFHKRAFSNFRSGEPASLLYDAFPDWIKRKKLYVFLDGSTEFLDFGNPELFYLAHKKCASLSKKYSRITNRYYEFKKNLWLPRGVKALEHHAEEFLLLSGSQDQLSKCARLPSRGVYYQLPTSPSPAIELEGLSYSL